MNLRPVAAEVTYPLRQAVLRPHQRVEELAQADDDAPDAGHFAAFADDGRVVGTGTVARRPVPGSAVAAGDDEPAWQIRGMAVDPTCRGQGIGMLMLDAILRHVADHGGGLAWCNARVPARGLYERAGFTTVGEIFEIDRIGPHIVMTRQVL